MYVLNDGGEVDLDLGNYERYLDVTLSRDNNITTGKIYREVIEKEVRPPSVDTEPRPRSGSSVAAITWARLCRCASGMVTSNETSKYMRRSCLMSPMLSKIG